MTSGFVATNSAAAVGIFPGHAAVDGKIAPLGPAEPLHGFVEMAARPQLPGDDETDAGALLRRLRGDAPADDRSGCAEQ
jgi:hypothetical protein